MEREYLKRWLNEKLDEIGVWNKISSSVIKRASIKENLYDNINELTDYLDSDVKFTERIYHILNDINELKICEYCNDNNLIFYKFSEGYKNCCKNKICVAKYKKVNIDENGLNGFERASLKQIETKAIKGNDGLTIGQRASLKQIETKRNDIDENGLNCYQRASKKSAETKRNDIDENGLNIHARTGKKLSQALKRIDVVTGLNISSTRAIKTAKTRKEDINETGLDGYQRAVIKTKNTRLNDIDENGLNGYQRGALKTAKIRKEDIDENGLNGFERAGLKMVETRKNDIDENGLNGFERAGLKMVETKIKRGIPFGSGLYSKEAVVVIKEIIDHFKLNEFENCELYYGESEWRSYINHSVIKAGSYDFVVRNTKSKIPILVVEYHGSAWHIDKERYNMLIRENRDETTPFDKSLKESYEKDQIKKQYMIDKYGCGYVEVFDYEWKENKEAILDNIYYLLKGRDVI